MKFLIYKGEVKNVEGSNQLILHNILLLQKNIMVYHYITPLKYDELLIFLAISNTTLDSVCFIEIKDDNHILFATDSETLIDSLVDDDDFERVKEDKELLRSLIFGNRVIRTFGNRSLMTFS